MLSLLSQAMKKVSSITSSDSLSLSLACGQGSAALQGCNEGETHVRRSGIPRIGLHQSLKHTLDVQQGQLIAGGDAGPGGY